MSAIWLTPGSDVQLHEYDALARAERWRHGDEFHPSEGDLREMPRIAPDGTRVVIYHPAGDVISGGERAIAVHGASPERVAGVIEARIHIVERRSEPEFHRFRARHTAACAGDGGVWFVDSERGQLLWQTPEPDAIPEVVAVGLPSAVAITAGAGALFVTSCDDPRTSRLARVDPATGAVTWLHDRLVRPAQLATIDNIVHVACADGLVCIDPAGAVEIPRLDVPLPHLLGTSGRALTWIDASGRHVVAFDGERAEVLATGDRLIALDVDGDRAYVLDESGAALECRRGRPPRTFSFAGDRRPRFAGILRIGPVLVTTTEWDGTWFTRTRCEMQPIGLPGIEDAPAELRALLGSDDAAWDVLADWLIERGVTVTGDQLRRAADATNRQCSDAHSGTLAGPLATSLVSFDREIGYRVSRAQVSKVLHASECY